MVCEKVSVGRGLVIYVLGELVCQADKEGEDKGRKRRREGGGVKERRAERENRRRGTEDNRRGNA